MLPASMLRSDSRKASRIWFAWIAVILMLLMSFQVLSMPGSASDVSLDVNENQMPVNETIARPNLLEATSTNISSSVVSIEASPGTIESFQGIQNRGVVSEVVKPNRLCYLTRTDNHLIFNTQFGTYVINETHPEYISVFSPSGKILTPESFFILVNSSISSKPRNGQIISITNDTLSVSYDLVTDAKEDSPIARMQVDVDFSNGRMPKLTARVVGEITMADWQVAWRIALLKGSESLYLENRTLVISAQSLMGINIQVPRYSLEVEVASVATSDVANLGINWSDEKEGSLTVCSDELSNGDIANLLQVGFEKDKRVIDPSLVSTVS